MAGDDITEATWHLDDECPFPNIRKGAFRSSYCLKPAYHTDAELTSGLLYVENIEFFIGNVDDLNEHRSPQAEAFAGTHVECGEAIGFGSITAATLALIVD